MCVRVCVCVCVRVRVHACGGEGESEELKLLAIFRVWDTARPFPLFVILLVAPMLFVQ